ncbi:S8 family serine peptidase [Streptomyces sp. NPDC090306]|uniref:S8 family serine peptidase n=1 Tax=Streptomyces sp. NPDC090306 TaxID=3365961 RepID=UPI0037F54818
MDGSVRHRTGAAAPTARRRTARPASAGLALLVAAGALTVTAAPASAAGGTVRLPVLPATVDADDPCTAGSSQRATAVPWEQTGLQLGRAWQFASGAGVTVGVVDTGVSLKAPALDGRVTAVGDAGTDCVGHGTFVAGLVAAGQRSGVRFAGVAQRARILAVRGSDERGAVTADRVAQGITDAVNGGADVVTVSAALPADSAALRSAVALAKKKDVLVVAAAVPDAPESASNTSPPARDFYPAADDGVLSVLDVDVNGDRPDGAYTTDSAQLSAPGDGVVGIGPARDGHYIGSGASLSAGFVAGAAALVRSVHPELSAAQTASLLRSSAYPADVPRVDPYAAVTGVLATSASPSASAPAGGPPGGAAPGPDFSPVRMPEDRAAGPMRRAMWPAVTGLVVVCVVVWAALLLPRGRRIGWRPTRPGAHGPAGGPPRGTGPDTDLPDSAFPEAVAPDAVSPAAAPVGTSPQPGSGNAFTG